MEPIQELPAPVSFVRMHTYKPSIALTSERMIINSIQANIIKNSKNNQKYRKKVKEIKKHASNRLAEWIKGKMKKQKA